MKIQKVFGKTFRVEESKDGPIFIEIATVSDYSSAIQRKIDSVAGERGYDNGVSCVSYVNSTNEIFAAEASAFNAWRDEVWAQSKLKLAEVESGERNPPSIDEILTGLPEINWPPVR